MDVANTIIESLKMRRDLSTRSYTGPIRLVEVTPSTDGTSEVFRFSYRYESGKYVLGMGVSSGIIPVTGDRAKELYHKHQAESAESDGSTLQKLTNLVQGYFFETDTQGNLYYFGSNTAPVTSAVHFGMLGTVGAVQNVTFSCLEHINNDKQHTIEGFKATLHPRPLAYDFTHKALLETPRFRAKQRDFTSDDMAIMDASFRDLYNRLIAIEQR
jgi:hypothetical protein